MRNEELYKRRKQMIPVLRTKLHELNQAGIKTVTEQELWNFLVDAKWKNRKEISISEMANDILSLCVEQKEM